MNQILVISTCVLFGLTANCQILKFKPSFSVTLDTSFGSTLLNQCSRSVPENISSFWTITQHDVESLENNLRSLSTSIDSIELFGLQYLGVTINEKRFIYINAFPLSDLELYKGNKYDPAKYPIGACDGGDYYWGVLFDLQTKQFSSLAFNGRL
jgi:hypothetical protein